MELFLCLFTYTSFVTVSTTIQETVKCEVFVILAFFLFTEVFRFVAQFCVTSSRHSAPHSDKYAHTASSQTYVSHTDICDGQDSVKLRSHISQTFIFMC